MRFLASILTLLAVVFVICVPYFVGHGLAVHSSGWILTGVGCGVLAAIAIVGGARLLRARRDATGETGAVRH